MSEEQMRLKDLAERMKAFSRKVERIILSRDLSASGQATAIAMITTMNLSTFSEAAASLAALSRIDGGGVSG